MTGGTKPALAPIAIVGMSCRLPGEVGNLDDFWTLLSRSRDGWTPMPSDRFPAHAFYHPNPQKGGCFNQKGGYFLTNDLSKFDAPFFNITEQEALAMDPQQRSLLECTFEALENAGIPKTSIAGQKMGVFIGGAASDYTSCTLRDLSQTPLFGITGNHSSILAGRIAHYFDLRGPCLTLDTACSSSLYALHQAVQSIRSGDCDSAVVAASVLRLAPDEMVSMSMLGLFNEHGRTYAFDNRAQSGFARGEGTGCLILKPLDQALADNDRIHSVIVNTGTNQDGRTVGLTAPNGDAQETLIRDVYTRAGVSPDDTGFVEAHGTGTKVGDPIEANALHRVFGSGRSIRNPLYLGSVKTNIGHLENASGIASVIKASLMLGKGFILPNVNFQKPNEAIPLNQWHFKVPTTTRPWPKGKRFISVNNFGFGGSNAHAVLEGSPTSIMEQFHGIHADSPRLIVLSAHDREAASQIVKNVGVYIERHPAAFKKRLFMDMVYTLCERRTHFPWRVATVASSMDELAQALNGVDATPTRASGVPTVAFCYSGQGAAYWGMGRELMATQPIFASTMKAAAKCLEHLQADFDLLDELAKDQDSSNVNAAYVSQAACTAIQLALTDLLSSWGVKPTAVIGHSSGEIGAAYATGAITLEDAMTVSYWRGLFSSQIKAKDSTLNGAMLAVGDSATNVKRIIESLTIENITVACENSPSSITASGDEVSIQALAAELDSQGIFNRQLRVDVAYHSTHMAVVAEEYMAALQDVHAQSIHEVKFFSSLQGTKLDDTSALTANYWVDNLTKPVLFSTALEALCRETKPDVIVEIGPHAALQGPIKQVLASISEQTAADVKYLSMLTRNRDASVTTLSVAGSLFVQGHDINFAAVNQTGDGDQGPKVLTDFIPYPWSGRSYWHDSRTSKQHRLKPFPRHDLLGLLCDNHSDVEPTWSNTISLDDIPWLRDHQMQSLVTFPFAGYLCMAVEAALQRAQLRGTSPEQIAGFKIREVTVSKALILDRETRYETVTSLHAFSEGTRSSSAEWDEFSISSWTSGRGWLEHCRGLIGIKKQASTTTLSLPESVSTFKRRVFEENVENPISLDNFYRELLANGAGYTGVFTLPVEANLRGNRDRSVSKLKVPNTSKSMPMAYETSSILPAAFMDLFFQLPFVILGAGRAEMAKLYMPTSIKEVDIAMPLPNQTGDAFQAIVDRQTDMTVPGPVDFNIEGWHESFHQPAISITGYRMTPVNGDAGPTSTPRSLCYKLEWEPLDQKDSNADHSAGPDSAVSLTDGVVPTGTASFSNLETVLITARCSDDPLVAAMIGQIQLNTNLKPAISSSANVQVNPRSHYICLCELDSPVLFDMSEQTFNQLQRLLLECASVLWVTAGAYRFCQTPESNLAQGLLRTARSEMQTLAATLDLDPESRLLPMDQASLIWSAFTSSLKAPDDDSSANFEFAEEHGKLVVPRITAADALNTDVFRATQSSNPYMQDWLNPDRRLKPVVGTYGALDSIYWEDDFDKPLGANEIEIKVAATGMNFKDVVIAMGKVASPYLGIECSGTVARVGSNMSSLNVGDRVCAMSLGAYSTYARCLSTSAAVIPEDMSLETAASIPVVFCTAYYGLVDLAHLEAGESVLIHAGSGGVGQAAIQLAQMLGAEIYTTVGSEEKKTMLMEQYNIPANRIFYSRDTSFGPAVREATDGKGVDVVLNSLAGDLLRETWECMALFGRFVEIGKRDIVANTRLEMAKFEYNCSFSSVDLTLVAGERPQIMGRLMTKAMELLTEKTIRPISPIRVVGISQVETALRKLQGGVAPGKTVVSHLEDEQVKATHPARPKSFLQDMATYVIIGGTGGLGRSIATMMVQRGAKHVVLLSRGGKMTCELQKLVDDSRVAGASIHVKACDVGDATQVNSLVTELHSTLHPIRGIVHAAMVLRDVLFETMTFEQYEAVVRSKVLGAWNFETALTGHPLDFFITLSSVAGIIGNKGQAAYAAANTFLDAFAIYRRQKGLPATSLDLSAVDGVGYLAENPDRQAKVTDTISATVMNEAEVLFLVEAAMNGKLDDEQCITGLDFNDPANLPFYAQDARFSHLRQAALAKSSNADGNITDATTTSISKQVQQAPSEEAARFVVKVGLKDKLSVVLMVPAETIEARQGTTTISDLGLDSLNAIEVRNWIGKELQAHLQVLELLTSGGIDDLAGLILKKTRLLKEGAWGTESPK